jgi:hypothetical protein
MTLKYPLELREDDVDYVIFTAREYRTNRNFAGQDNAGGDGPPKGQPIVLYMPNSTPAMSNAQAYGNQEFTGPLGLAKADLGISVAAGINNLATGSESANVQSAIDNVKRQFESIKNNLPEIGGQFALQTVSGLMGMNAAALTVLQRGQIYNPNIELIYQTPQLRSFAMDFVFAPKSEDETRMINDIIKEFKIWSAPAKDGAMLEVPCVWSISYKTGGSDNLNMNQFKKAVLTNIMVQANPTSDMHNSFADGMPVITSMSLAFQEVDIITREDHEEGGNQGF